MTHRMLLQICASLCAARLIPLMLSPISICAQEVSSRSPVIRSQSSLVLVDVIARDTKNGLPLQGLRKEHFRLLDNGQEVSVTTFDTEAAARPVILWLAVICNERGKIGGSANYAGKEALFRPALDHLDQHDMIGVAHWCDNGETQLDLPPTEDRDAAIRALADVIKPIAFQGGTSQSDAVGEVTFRKMVRLIIQDANRRKPQALPVIVFLDGDHTGQPMEELNELVGDFLETSGIVFGIKDSRYPFVFPLIGEHAEILHYMAKHTGGEYTTAVPERYAALLESILVRLHHRYQLGFVPAAIDGKRHKLKVELTREARRQHKSVRLQFRLEYLAVKETPDWAR
jgi:hypothetical protein